MNETGAPILKPVSAFDIDKNYSKLVKAEFSYETDLKDEDFQAQVKVALDEIAAMKKDDPKAPKKTFGQFMDHYADASYYDRMSDLERLVLLVTRRPARPAAPRRRRRVRTSPRR